MASRDKIVELNVGGSLFTTSLTTLRQYRETSMLAAMFDPDSGRPPPLQDSNGAYFIDRDPKVFAIILGYLRTGRMFRRKDDGLSTEELLNEAKACPDGVKKDGHFHLAPPNLKFVF